MMLELELVDEHTIAPGLLTGGWVLDVGCRNFRFSSAMVAKGCQVVGLDPAPDVNDPPPGVNFMRRALEHGGPDIVTMRWEDNGNGSHVVPERTVGKRVFVAQVVRLVDLMGTFGIERWDVIKLDCEGAEYEILKHWPGPIATQLTVEFHDFAERRPKDLVGAHEQIWRQLDQWYYVHRHLLTEQWGHMNYWDSLFILKPEFR